MSSKYKDVPINNPAKGSGLVDLDNLDGASQQSDFVAGMIILSYSKLLF